AEDGIRDKLVTGVQTCALPISLGGCGSGGRRIAVRLSLVAGRRSSVIGNKRDTRRPATDDSATLKGQRPKTKDRRPTTNDQRPRSEERRVGKECRKRGEQDQRK